MPRRVRSTPASKHCQTSSRTNPRTARKHLLALLNPAMVSPLQAALMLQASVNLEADAALLISSEMADQYAGPHGFESEGEIYTRMVATGGDVDARVAAYVKAVERTDSFTDAECEANDAVKLAVADVACMAEVDEVLKHATEQGRRPLGQGLTGLAVVGTMLDALAARLATVGKASAETLAAEIDTANRAFEKERGRREQRAGEEYDAEIAVLGQLAVEFAGRLFEAPSGAAAA